MHCPGCGRPTSPQEDGEFSHVFACGYVGKWPDHEKYEKAEWLVHQYLEEAADKPIRDPATGKLKIQRRRISAAEEIIKTSLEQLNKLTHDKFAGIEEYSDVLHIFQSDILKTGGVQSKTLDEFASRA